MNDQYAMLPADLVGRTLLDVGCGRGDLAREAARRGARVTAIDIDDQYLVAAQAGSTGDGIDYRHGDVEAALPPGRFDHVVCHNLLHRVRNPIAVLDRLVAATGSTLTMAVTGLDGERPQRLLRRDYGATAELQDEIAAMPLTLVGRNGTPGRKREQKFFFSPAALRHLLMEQRRYFSSFDVGPGPGQGRYVIRVQRREVDHLVIISGPTGAGKSTFLDRLTDPQPTVPSVALGSLGPAIAGYQTVNGDGIADLDSKHHGLLFHYDLLRPWRRDAAVHDRDEALHLVDCSRRVDVVVLLAGGSTLRRRLAAELSQLTDQESRAGQRLCEVLDLYRDPARVIARIEAWLDFCRRKGIEPSFVDCSNDYRTIPADRWADVVGLDP